MFAGQNFSSVNIFFTKQKFRKLCPIFAWLLYWHNGQKFGQNFDHQVKVSLILSDELLSNALGDLKQWIQLLDWYVDPIVASEAYHLLQGIVGVDTF